MKHSLFAINVAVLRGRPGLREEIVRKGSLDELATSGAAVDPASDILFTGRLEAIDGHRIVVTGSIRAQWSGECRRCLNPATDDIFQDVREIFEDDATEGDTYPMTQDVADLEPLIREVTMLEIPIAPLCNADCLGLCPDCGTDRNKQPCECLVDLSDPRWSALDALKDSE